MVVCACGKEIPKVPSWLATVKVEFVCGSCPNRKIQSIVDVKLPNPEPEAVDPEVAAELAAVAAEEGDVAGPEP